MKIWPVNPRRAMDAHLAESEREEGVDMQDLQDAVAALRIGGTGEIAGIKMRANCLRAALSRAVASELERAEKAEAAVMLKPRKRAHPPVTEECRKPLKT